MKNFLVLILCFLQLSCNGQNDKNNKSKTVEKKMENPRKLNISEFKKKARITGKHFSIDNSSNFKTEYNEYYLLEEKNGSVHKFWGEDDGFFYEEVKEQGKDYIDVYTYLPKNGNLVNQETKSLYGFVMREKEFNNDGVLINDIDYNKDYQFGLEKVKEYLISKQVNVNINAFIEFPTNNLDIPIPQIKRNTINKVFQPENYPPTTSKIWQIEGVEANYNGVKGIYYIDLDGDTGKELLVKKFRGKKSGKRGIGTYADYEIILKAK
ncbi:hypothetical protein ACFQO9_13860 [Chryseobacterium zhengzhouense]|uniref:Uncharacterized protein n=1 Tax=Chryseobacterium zhengzhouense TaxID=1636086 RepID=A0ABW2M316_9FLAO